MGIFIRFGPIYFLPMKIANEVITLWTINRPFHFHCNALHCSIYACCILSALVELNDRLPYAAALFPTEWANFYFHAAQLEHQHHRHMQFCLIMYSKITSQCYPTYFTESYDVHAARAHSKVHTHRVVREWVCVSAVHPNIRSTKTKLIAWNFLEIGSLLCKYAFIIHDTKLYQKLAK